MINCTFSKTEFSEFLIRLLTYFQVSFGLFNVTYWYSYFQAQKPFDWDDHALKGKFRSHLRWSSINDVTGEGVNDFVTKVLS